MFLMWWYDSHTNWICCPYCVFCLFTVMTEGGKGGVGMCNLAWREISLRRAFCLHFSLDKRKTGANPPGQSRYPRKVGRLLQSRIRRLVPTRPFHVTVTSLKDPFLFNYCVPHKWWRDILIQSQYSPCSRLQVCSLWSCSLRHCD